MILLHQSATAGSEILTPLGRGALGPALVSFPWDQHSEQGQLHSSNSKNYIVCVCFNDESNKKYIRGRKPARKTVRLFDNKSVKGLLKGDREIAEKLAETE